MKDKKMGCGICLVEVFDRFVFEINIKMKLFGYLFYWLKGVQGHIDEKSRSISAQF